MDRRVAESHFRKGPRIQHPIEVAVKLSEGLDFAESGNGLLGERSEFGSEESQEGVPLAFEQALLLAFPAALPFDLLQPGQLHLLHLPISLLRKPPLELPSLGRREHEVGLDEIEQKDLPSVVEPAQSHALPHQEL